MTDPLLLTAPQAAALAGVSEQGLRWAIRHGNLPALRVGQRAWVIRKPDLDRWIVARLQKQAGKEKR